MFPLTDSFKTIAIKPFRNNVSDIDKNDAGRELVCLIFSKDRALQLDACLRSLQRSIRPTALNEISVHVVYKCSRKLHSLTYKNLREHWTDINWHLQRNFLNDIKLICHRREHILFLSDDTLFVKEWNLSSVLNFVSNCNESVGFSLRLGKNTNYCHSLDVRQKIPVFTPCKETSVNSFNWTAEEHDFAYPLELSSSVYRSELILNLLKDEHNIQTPAEIERILNGKKDTLAVNFPILGCFDQSVAFSNPLIPSQPHLPFNTQYSTLELANEFADGKRIDTQKLWGLTTKGARQTEATEWIESTTPTEIIPPVSLKPTVSVVIPCYNYGKYLKDAVESVRNQTLAGVETIVVDGGSNDWETPSVLNQLEKEGCKVIRRKGRHLVGSNRNVGIEHASSELICCLDADDCIDPTYLEKVFFLFATDDYDLVGASAKKFGLSEEKMGVPSHPSEEDIIESNCIVTAAVFRKSLWDHVDGFEDFGLAENYIFEDWHFWCKCAQATSKIYNIADDFLIQYRVHDKTSLSKQNDSVAIIDRHRQFILDSLKNKSISNYTSSRSTGFLDLAKQWAEAESFPEYSPPTLVTCSKYSAETAEIISSQIIQQDLLHPILYVATDDPLNNAEEWIDSRAFDNNSAFYGLSFFLNTEEERQSFIQFLLLTKSIQNVVNFGSERFHNIYRLLTLNFPELNIRDCTNLLKGAFDAKRGREYLVADPLHGTGETVLEHIRITVTGLKEEASGGSEVWLLDILDKDMGTLLVPELKTLLPEGWEPRKSEGSPRGFALLAAAECQLEINLPQHTSLVFLTHAYSGIVVVENLSKQTKQEVSLYGSSSGQITIGTGSLNNNDLLSSIAASQSSAAVEDEIIELTISAHPAEKDPKRNSIKFFGITDKDHNSYPDGLVQFLEVEWTPSLHQNRLGLSMTGKDGQKMRVRMPKSALLHFERSPHAGELGFIWEGRTRFIDMSYPEYKKVTECLSYRFE